MLLVCMEEMRARDGNLHPSRPKVKGVLCVDCFKQATTTFSPNPFCKTCTEFQAYGFGSSLGALPYSAAMTAPATAPGVTFGDLTAVPALQLTTGVFGTRPTAPATGGSLLKPACSFFQPAPKPGSLLQPAGSLPQPPKPGFLFKPAASMPQPAPKPGSLFQPPPKPDEPSRK